MDEALDDLVAASASNNSAAASSARIATAYADKAKEYADQIKEALKNVKIQGVITYKGSVQTYNDLNDTTKVPTKETGDMWNVKDTGSNYVYDGETWDLIGQTIDLSGYATKAELGQKQTKPEGTTTVYGVQTKASGYGVAIGYGANAMDYPIVIGSKEVFDIDYGVCQIKVDADGNMFVGSKKVAFENNINTNLKTLSNSVTVLGAEKAESSHTHLIADVSELTQKLTEKASVIHTHNASDITDFTLSISSKADVDHTHTQDSITGLSAKFAKKQDVLTPGNGISIVNDVISVTNLPDTNVPTGGKATVIQDGFYVTVANEDGSLQAIHVGIQSGEKLYLGFTTSDGDYAEWGLLSEAQTKDVVNKTKGFKFNTLSVANNKIQLKNHAVNTLTLFEGKRIDIEIEDAEDGYAREFTFVLDCVDAANTFINWTTFGVYSQDGETDTLVFENGKNLLRFTEFAPDEFLVRRTKISDSEI